MPSTKVQKLIEKHALQPHPEGGWYRRVFQSKDLVLPLKKASERYQGEPRHAGSAIIYLLEKGDFSAWHRVQSDETWCFHTGEPLRLRVIDSCGALQEITLGIDIGHLQLTVRAQDIFSAEPLGAFSLVSCVVTPGFDFKDFELISKQAFIQQYPKHQTLARLIRANGVAQMPTP